MSEQLLDIYVSDPIPHRGGGHAKIYFAERRLIGRTLPVALKMAPWSDAKWERMVVEYKAQECAKRASMHVVGVYGEPRKLFWEGQYWVVLEMEKINGCDLKDALARTGPMAPADAVAVAIQVAKALAGAHGIGIVHRDIKPANLLIEDVTGRIRLCDFGVASVPGESVTGPSDRMGTDLYMAPEQHLHRDHPDYEKAAVQADIYALGAVLYEMLAGSRAWRKSPDLWREKRQERYVPLPKALPRSLRRVVKKCMRFDPLRRYGDAAELLDALQRLPDLAGMPAQAKFAGLSETEPVSGAATPRQRMKTPGWGPWPYIAAGIAIGPALLWVLNRMPL